MTVSLFVRIERTLTSEGLEHWDRNAATFALGVHACKRWVSARYAPRSKFAMEVILPYVERITKK